MNKTNKEAIATDAIEERIEESSTEPLDRIEYEISYGIGKFSKYPNPNSVT